MENINLVIIMQKQDPNVCKDLNHFFPLLR